MTAAAVLLLDPVNNHHAEGGGDRAQFGWLPLDEEIEAPRPVPCARATRPGNARSPIKVQTRIISQGVTVPLGQFLQPMARCSDVSGNVVLAGDGVLERHEEVVPSIRSCLPIGPMPLCGRNRTTIVHTTIDYGR